ncbi:MAG: hypothetical protein NVS4B8_02220 [Herpetosiphon sp.]
MINGQDPKVDGSRSQAWECDGGRHHTWVAGRSYAAEYFRSKVTRAVAQVRHLLTEVTGKGSAIRMKMTLD